MNPNSRAILTAHQVRNERREGPRYAFAIREAAIMRRFDYRAEFDQGDMDGSRPATTAEREHGIPAWRDREQTDIETALEDATW